MLGLLRMIEVLLNFINETSHCMRLSQCNYIHQHSHMAQLMINGQEKILATTLTIQKNYIVWVITSLKNIVIQQLLMKLMVLSMLTLVIQSRLMMMTLVLS
ncbi:Uncharacterised protein [Streptococcus pneumoniae]|nr:Uncharacterised protein [Streptococcus pneumoniae]CGG29629.1 Uncharacterised protein [Streptococcus pneumoniae]CMU64722.1 Uncharacterised protein [Streptococcus pneumoniae]SNF86404.1 Uncharacterised protein [Streptococcus pneumoniae]SNH81181.1 Uncharacterised protein [Streptococcus pneumoniae]